MPFGGRLGLGQMIQQALENLGAFRLQLTAKPHPPSPIPLRPEPVPRLGLPQILVGAVTVLIEAGQQLLSLIAHNPRLMVAGGLGQRRFDQDPIVEADPLGDLLHGFSNGSNVFGVKDTLVQRRRGGVPSRGQGLRHQLGLGHHAGGDSRIDAQCINQQQPRGRVAKMLSDLQPLQFSDLIQHVGLQHSHLRHRGFQVRDELVFSRAGHTIIVAHQYCVSA